MELLFGWVLALAALVLLLVPAGLIIAASNTKESPAPGWRLMTFGGLILCVVSLDILVTIVVARFGGPDVLASYALVSAYVGNGLSYVALLALGVGMLRAARSTTLSTP